MYSWNRSLSYSNLLRRTTTAPSPRREGRRSPVGLPTRREQQDLASAGSPHFTKSGRRVDGVARLSCVWTWTRFLLLLLLLLPSTLGHPLRRGQREKRRFAVGLILLASIQIWRQFIASGYGDLLPLRIDANDSQFRRPLPIGCGLFFGYHVLYLLPDVKVRNPLYCISEWSLSLLYCMCITDTVRIAACSFVPYFFACID